MSLEKHHEILVILNNVTLKTRIRYINNSHKHYIEQK